MELCVNGKGRVILRDVTDEAIAYLQTERRKVGRDDDNFYWLFSKSYEGTVYLHVDPLNSKQDTVAILDVLFANYGLKAETQAARLLVEAWRKEAARRKEEVSRSTEAYDREKALKAEITAVKRILNEGCASCERFFYDGDFGRCGACAGALLETPLSFKNGKRDGDGTLRLGQKFFPIAGCMYLKEKER